MTAELVAPDEPQDTHFTWDLDDDEAREQAEQAARAPVYVDVVAKEHDFRPIVPASLRGANLRPTIAQAAGRTKHRTLYHLVRVPRYAALVALWGAWGVLVVAGRQIRWWWVVEQTPARQEAANRADGPEWRALHNVVRATRLWRGGVLLAEVVGLGVAVVALVVLAGPRWWAVAAAGVLCAAARAGRPAHKPIVTPAVVAPRFRQLTSDIVLRAYYAAKLGHPDKPDQQVKFESVMARDGAGSRVVVILPHGRTFSEVVDAREKLASGLDVTVAQVYLSRDPSSNRRHVLYVADVDPLAVPAGLTPLLRCQQTDIWKPAPLGVDERGRPIGLDMMWSSILIGARPRQGKTFTARQLALYAALDPYVKLTVLDASGKPDWRGFRLVADRCAFGLAMTRDGDPVEIVLDTLRAIKADVQDRYERLSRLPVDVCPEGKLTRDVARDPRYAMPVHVVVLEEFQEYYDLGDASKEIASLLQYLVKVAPAAGIILLDATQRPSGIGTGQINTMFTAFRDNHGVRFALRCGSWQVSDMVLGAGAYSEGYDASTLLPSYKGVGILRGATDDTPTVRTYLAEAPDAEKILIAARAMRERAGTLTGMAAGEDIARASRDVLADVRNVYYAGQAWISWKQLAARLADEHPDAYADTTPDAISAEVRAHGVPSVNGKQDGAVLRGAKLADVDAAISRREITR